MASFRPFLRRNLRAFAVCAAMAAPLFAQADEYRDVTELLRQGKPADAMARADQFLSSKPRDPQMRFLRGVILTEQGQTADAITVFTRLTEDYPELPEPYNNLAVLYAGQSQFDKARASLEMAIRINPSYATAHENLGDVYAKLASQAYSRALQLDPRNTAVQPKLALIREVFTPGARAAIPAAPAASAPPATRPSPIAPSPTAPSETMPSAPSKPKAPVPKTSPAPAGAKSAAAAITPAAAATA